MKATCSPVAVYVFPGRLRIHPVPKAGSDAITRATPTAHRESVDQWGPEYRWAVVRHPLERLVSAWAYFCFEDRLRNQPRLRQIGYEAGMPFEKFLRVVLEHGGENNHTCPQAHHLGPHGFDRIGRLERLHDEWAALRERFPFLLRIQRRNTSRHGPWQDYYTRETRRAAESAYAADLEIYEQAGGD